MSCGVLTACSPHIIWEELGLVVSRNITVSRNVCESGQKRRRCTPAIRLKMDWMHCALPVCPHLPRSCCKAAVRVSESLTGPHRLTSVQVAHAVTGLRGLPRSSALDFLVEHDMS